MPIYPLKSFLHSVIIPSNWPLSNPFLMSSVFLVVDKMHSPPSVHKGIPKFIWALSEACVNQVGIFQHYRPLRAHFPFCFAISAPCLNKEAQSGETESQSYTEKDLRRYQLDLSNSDRWSLKWSTDKVQDVFLHKARTVEFAPHLFYLK